MLVFHPAHRGTDIPAALTFLNRAVRRRAIVFLLTDFLHSFNGQLEGWGTRFGAPPEEGKRERQQNIAGTARRDVIQELGNTNRRHDVVCLHLHDPREGVLPEAGLVTIEDAETGELLELDSARSSVREGFVLANAERLADLDRALNRAGVDTLRLNTAQPFAHVLQRFFEIRRGRRRR